MLKASLLIGFLAMVAACGPTNPTTVVDGVEVNVFQDPESDFESAEVFDADGDPVFFSTRGELLYTPQGLAFSGWRVNRNRVRDDFGSFEIAFGREGGEDRAYFVESFDGTLCDISVFNGQIDITSTDRFPPFEQ